jgi:hypothetical protein
MPNLDFGKSGVTDSLLGRRPVQRLVAFLFLS